MEIEWYKIENEKLLKSKAKYSLKLHELSSK